MTLDFFTLYIVILLNSFFMSLVWWGFVVTHRDIPGAPMWLAAACCTTLGGLLLAGDGTTWGRAFCIAGNGIITLGFCFMWTGVRMFYGAPPQWRVCAAIVGLGMVLMLVAGPDRPGQNIAYAASQMMPMSLAIRDFTKLRPFSMGALAALLAVFLAYTGHVIEAVLNGMRILGLLSSAAYYEVAAGLLLAVLCGATLWNLGFLLMAVDRLSERLEAQALHDELTHLPNRRAFLERAEREMAGVRAKNGTLSLFLFDLDRFKHINDTMGHAAGDACLRHFATIAAQVCAGHGGLEGGLARLGGDEFALIAAGLSEKQEEKLALDLVRAISEHPLQWREWPMFLSVSIGVASWRGVGPLSLQRLTEQADAALYEMKRRGRNGYVVAANEALTDTGSPAAILV